MPPTRSATLPSAQNSTCSGPASDSAYELNLSKLRDEELVVLAQECRYAPAASEILSRMHELSNRLIARLARQRELQMADKEEAQQDAVFAIHRAIEHYDTLQMGIPHGCPFCVFVRRVVQDRFKDFTKHLWRVNRHQRQPQSALGRGEEEQGFPERGMDCLDENSLNNPVAQAQEQERQVRIAQALARLKPRERQLAEELMSGSRLRTIADHLDLTLDATKHLWRRVKGRLAELLRDEGSALCCRIDARFRRSGRHTEKDRATD